MTGRPPHRRALGRIGKPVRSQPAGWIAGWAGCKSPGRRRPPHPRAAPARLRVAPAIDRRTGRGSATPRPSHAPARPHVQDIASGTTIGRGPSAGSPGAWPRRPRARCPWMQRSSRQARLRWSLPGRWDFPAGHSSFATAWPGSHMARSCGFRGRSACLLEAGDRRRRRRIVAPSGTGAIRPERSGRRRDRAQVQRWTEGDGLLRCHGQHGQQQLFQRCGR